MAEPKWDVKELRLWVLSSLGYRIPKNIEVKINKRTDAGNYTLTACEFTSGKFSYRETLEHMYRLAAVIRRAGGYACVHEMNKSDVLSMEIDMGGTIADKNKIAQRELWG